MGEKMVEKVTRLMKEQDRIRNIAICAHIDHGKTTFSDNLLAGAGMMSEELAGKQLVLDFHEDEIARGITIDAANVSMVHVFDSQEYLINLIDTPGHVDFGGDVTRAMRAVDGCIVLCCAVEGIMPQTETVLRQALKERVKPILFINKVDRLIKELQLTPEQMQERFVNIITSVNQFIESIAPDEFKKAWQVNVQDGSVCFGSAFHNWAMSINYMKKKGVSFKEIIDAYKGGGDAYKELKKKAPLHDIILSAVITHLPNPIKAQQYRIPKLWHGDLESEEGKSLIICNPKGPLFFVITKVVVDPQAGEISAGRLFSGTMSKGIETVLNRAKRRMRVQQIFIYNGAKREIVNDVPSGNIIGIAGVKAMPGETITFNETEPFEEIVHLFEPVVTKSIEAKSPSDLPKLIEVLRMVQKEDPTIKVEINEETGEHLMHGMGDPKTKELLKSGDVSEGRIKKKDLVLRDKFMACGWDTKDADKIRDIYHGNIFVDQTRGIVYINEIIELVLDMFEDVMRTGPLAREPCVGIRVNMTDCKLHEDAIHRGPAQMYPAVREGIRGAMMISNPLIFEPVQTLQFEAPIEYMGEISKLISNKRGQMIDMNQEGAEVVVKGKLPVAEMFGMTSDLRSATGGRGNHFLVDQSFEKLPEEMQPRVIKNIRQRKGLSENQ